jgi:hypothetical protein
MARGAGHVLLGADHPYDMAEANPVDFILSVPGLSDADRARICGGNAARLLGVKREIARPRQRCAPMSRPGYHANGSASVAKRLATSACMWLRM